VQRAHEQSDIKDLVPLFASFEASGRWKPSGPHAICSRKGIGGALRILNLAARGERDPIHLLARAMMEIARPKPPERVKACGNTKAPTGMRWLGLWELPAAGGQRQMATSLFW
jgi:hypothetical protein